MEILKTRLFKLIFHLRFAHFLRASAVLGAHHNRSKLHETLRRCCVACRVRIKCAWMSVSLFLLSSMVVVVVDDLFLNAREEKELKKRKYILCVFVFKMREEERKVSQNDARNWEQTVMKAFSSIKKWQLWMHFSRRSLAFCSFAFNLHTCF